MKNVFTKMSVTFCLVVVITAGSSMFLTMLDITSPAFATEQSNKDKQDPNERDTFKRAPLPGQDKS
ncbi:hypothetical protein LA52FAK_20590 [Desulforhopalus sp. 52FAK]